MRLADIDLRSRLERIFKKRTRSAREENGDLLQSACANAGGSLLVLLYLLEGNTDPLFQLGLAHRQHLAAHANAQTSVLVDGVRRLSTHRE
jgi:hypothetical protein